MTPLERLADRLGYLLVRRPADAHAITGESLYLLAVHAGHALGLVDAAVERALDPHGDEAERISAAELADIETACAQTERTVEHIRAGARRLHQAQQTLPLREGVA